MKAATMLSPIPMQGIKEAVLPRLNQELEGNSFIELIQQQMGALSNEQEVEQEKIEIVDLIEGTLGQLNHLLISFTPVQSNEALRSVQADLNSLLADIQQGSTPLRLDQQQLESFLQKAHLILHQADNAKNQLPLTLEDQQKWNDALNTAFKQMDQATRDLQGRGRNERLGDAPLKKTNLQLNSLIGFVAPMHRFTNPSLTKWIALDKVNNGQPESQISSEKLIRQAAPGELIFPQRVDSEEIPLLRMETNPLNQQPIQGNPTSLLSEIPGNKVPLQQLMNYMEAHFMTNRNSKAGDSIQKLILQLQPESLGKLDVHIQSHNGQITAQFVVENATAKHAVEEQMTQLRQSLQTQGVPVNHLEVIEASTNNQPLFQHQHKQQHEQRPPFQPKGKKAKEYLEIEEDLKSQLLLNQHSLNTSINYIV